MLYDHPKDPTAVQFGAIFVSLELSRNLADHIAVAGKMSKHGVTAGNTGRLMARFAQLQRKAAVRTGKTFPIIGIEEAGLDGFWIHRVLQQKGSARQFEMAQTTENHADELYQAPRFA